MAKVVTLDVNDPQLEQKLQALKNEVLEHTKKDIEKLGKILRRRGLFSFKMFLRKRKINLPQEHIPLFMDYLITKRIDLKDMEGDARQRLRQHLLKDEPENVKTEHYRLYVENCRPPNTPTTCKDCLWFMLAPPGEHTSCVKLGTKGSDAPCYGFVKK